MKKTVLLIILSLASTLSFAQVLREWNDDINIVKTMFADADEDEPDPLEVYGIIVDQPEGELKTYLRNGESWHVRGNKIQLAEQRDMTIQVVVANDGKTAYIQNPIAYVKAGTWVKGTLENNKITIPTKIYLTYNYRYEAAQQLYIMKEQDADNGTITYTPDESIESIVYTIEGDNISLNMPDNQHILSAIWTDDNSWTGYGDFSSTYSPFNLKPTQLPTNAVNRQYEVSGEDYYNTLNNIATVAIAGNKVYIKGLCNLFPDNWIAGERDGYIVTFPKEQFIGLTYGSAGYLLGSTSGYNDNITDVVFYYDDEEDSYILASTYLIFNGNTYIFDDYDFYTELSLTPMQGSSMEDLAKQNIVKQEHFDLQGRPVSYNHHGVTIVRETGKNSTINTKKHVK